MVCGAEKLAAGIDVALDDVAAKARHRRDRALEIHRRAWTQSTEPSGTLAWWVR